jgi:AcrR family transcriptional regulator
MNDAGAFERPYDNSYRAAQAAQTRASILDALVRVLARGVAELSIPAVAREAGVSPRTVYRNFPTKRDLLDGLNEHLDRRIGYQLDANLAGPADLLADVRVYFQALDGMDDAVRAARLNPVVGEARRDYAGGVSLKRQAIESALAPLAGGVAPEAYEYLFNIVFTLFGQFTLQRMKDDLGLTATQAADSVVWALQTLFAAAREDAGHEQR